MAASAHKKPVFQSSDIAADEVKNDYRPASAEDLDPAELERTAHSSPARELQHGLSQWAAGSAEMAIADDKLPVAQRFVVILTASIALWVAIIGGLGLILPIW